MKVLRDGSLESPVFNAICEKCGCEVEFCMSEATWQCVAQSDNTISESVPTVSCPQCDGTCWLLLTVKTLMELT